MRFHYLARAVICKDDKVLLAHQIGANHSFLPGGHIGMGEKAEVAVVREIMEEIGAQAIVRQFIGAVEATWVEKKQLNHEINLVFEVKLPHIHMSEPPKSYESHLEFMWIPLAELEAHHLLPHPMVDCILSWDHRKHGFWASAIE